MSILRQLKRAIRSVDEYVDLASRILADGSLTPVEANALEAKAANLDMTAEERHKAHIRVIEAMASRFMADGYLDQQELDILTKAMDTVQVSTTQINPATNQALGRMICLQQVAAGRLPTLAPSQIPLALVPGEVAHLLTPCRIEEERVVGRQTVGGYSGVSFRICKGVRYHIGGSRGRSYPVTAQVAVSQGDLILTSHRAVYLGNTKGFNKPWSKVTAVEPYNNAIVFYFSDRQNAATLLYNDPGMAPLVEAVCGNLLS